MRPITGGMNKRACVLTLLAIAAGCSSRSERLTLPASLRAPQVFLNVRIAEEHNAIRRVPLEEYVAGTIISEVAPPADGFRSSWTGADEDEVAEGMYEVQAVVARTYAIANRARHAREGFDLCSTTHCQLYEPSRLKTSRWAANGRTAAVRTAGTVLWHKQTAARALFHADCGGHTTGAEHVWGGISHPYLAALRDDDVDGVVHTAWKYEVTNADLLEVLNADPRMRVGRRLDGVEVIDRDSSGRAETIALHGERERLVRGEDLRARLARAFGSRTIRSTMFTVVRDGRTFVFEGRGFGHGVGLCQAGALARLKAGARPRAVLERYFPNTTIRTLGN